MVKTIRGMDDDTWTEIKRRAKAENKTIAAYLRSLINEEPNDETILDGEKHLDDETAKRIKRRSKALRDDFSLNP